VEYGHSGICRLQTIKSGFQPSLSQEGLYIFFSVLQGMRLKADRTSKGRACRNIPYLAKTLSCRISDKNLERLHQSTMFHDFTKYHDANESTCSASCFAASGAAIPRAAFCIFFCTTSSPVKTARPLSLETLHASHGTSDEFTFSHNIFLVCIIEKKRVKLSIFFSKQKSLYERQCS
jgi:hypothetical protein